jgi:hypothetical protein
MQTRGERVVFEDFSLTTEVHRGIHRGAQRVSFVYLCEVLCVPLWLK